MSIVLCQEAAGIGNGKAVAEKECLVYVIVPRCPKL
jgi:hypothetical protein